jgi:hypothetical protein
MSMFIDPTGAQHQVPLEVAMYRASAENGQSLRQYVNTLYPTNAERDGSAFEQICASEGIVLRNDVKSGMRASSVRQMMEGTGPGMQAATTKEAVPASRLLFPAAVMALVEDRLAVDLSATDIAFNSLVAYEESINGERVEQPVINYTNAAENAPQTISQLALPASMITITASDRAYKLPVYSQGIEVSDQAAQNTTIDLVALTLARTFALQANKRAQGYMLALKDGDIDNGDGSLTSLGYATTQTLMDAAPVAGAITQKAWMNWLTQSTDKRQIDVIVTDLATAIKIEGRTGKPVITGDNPNSPRIDTLMQVLNPQWAPAVRVFLVTPGSGWPADTIMGMDSRYAIRRIRSLTASFASTEAFVTKRSTISRFDYGEIVNRMFPEAFSQFTVV